MRIVFTVSALYAGGAEKVVTSLANNFAEKGHDVSIVLVSARSKESFHKIDEKISVVPLLENQKHSNSLFRVKILKRCLLDLEPDIVIAFLPHICIYTAFALKNTGIPFICSERNDPHHYSLIYKILLRYAFNKSNGEVFQTEDAMKWYKSKKGVVINNPISLVYYPKEDCLKENKKVVFVGRISKQKNYKMLIKSFASFLTFKTDYKLHIYGEGNGEKYIRKYAMKKGIGDNVLFFGKTNKWQEEEFASSLFVSTSNFEGMPNSLAEAASLGLRCVATDCPIGGTRRLSYSFSNISLSKIGDYKTFAKKMAEATESKRNVFGIPNEFSLESVAQKWIVYIKEITG